MRFDDRYVAASSDDSATPAGRTPAAPDNEAADVSDVARLAEDLLVAHDAAPLSRDRLIALRQWIQSGLYDTPEVLAVVARRLMQSGEL